MLSEVPDAVTLNGSPVMAVKMPLICQPPKSFDVKPEVFNHVLPLPKGNSHMPETFMTCVRS